MIGKSFTSQLEGRCLTIDVRCLENAQKKTKQNKKIKNKQTNKTLGPTRLQLFRLQLCLLGCMLRLAVEGLVVTVLVLAGWVQSLCLASRRDWCVEVKDLGSNKEDDDVVRDKKKRKKEKKK